jgi:hypothetical protein
MAVVADSSPLVYLAALSDFHFLPQLFGSVIIPPAVYREVVEQGHGFHVKKEVEAALGGWMQVTDINDRHRANELMHREHLDAGESEAIVLAQELHPDRLLMDDQAGVSSARSLGILVTRTPVIYIEAKTIGWIPNVRDRLDALRKAGFRLKESDYKLILSKTNELHR